MLEAGLCLHWIERTKDTKIILVHQSRIIYEFCYVSSVPSDRTCLGSEVGESLGTGDGRFEGVGDGDGPNER